MTKKKKQPPKLLNYEDWKSSYWRNPELTKQEKIDRLLYEDDDGEVIMHPEIVFMLRDIHHWVKKGEKGDHKWAAYNLLELERMLETLYKLPYGKHGYQKPINPKKPR